ncbi:flagellar biosynthetic protein FliO [Clostridium beijerinckii]|uniref:flagellar biosynthetic protein FliO n=1 Tax=Clostridium beijerinckii TaxID=1520 RepID=UPI00156D4AC2|nr:flagellar biosynthetic protein FliO [Clostridium beijerinckii]NRT73664.1 flagellar protein FliO/FliZ [Clostridium beijerinckii]
MNFEFLGMISQLILALGLTLGLMFLTFKLMNTKFNINNDNRYIKVIDRVQITKETSMLVVKIGKKGYVMTSSSGHMEKLLELSEEEIEKIELDKKRAAQEMSETYKKMLSKCKDTFLTNIKNKTSKEEKHEK